MMDDLCPGATANVSLPIVGCSSPERVEQAAAALNIHLDQSDIDYLEEPYNAHELVGPHARPGDKPLAGTTTPPSR
ncbi:hypothetical protein [Bifidobacterium subtile]|jgi:diketogulonate reductase-like aldo/keto reductase|uniref:Aldo/keto reductase n=1 Tax=Bifidobacterium subtile TaxID=77635 RepID=A0A087EBD9_9BIFI|nr:hypothetical protein [Bifidobacterium subtile]KFJ05090.1 aldo/keto reductase [Bifidobacterium subtile]MCI1223558.1 hypothetical protein [Bifidobacterium subtile]MCI1241118.1 hypothetical protein [Bifidobacterium subtile]MCI1258306.1 hypothetical protein [Bifidobacterium subtile]